MSAITCNAPTGSPPCSLAWALCSAKRAWAFLNSLCGSSNAVAIGRLHLLRNARPAAGTVLRPYGQVTVKPVAKGFEPATWQLATSQVVDNASYVSSAICIPANLPKHTRRLDGVRVNTQRLHVTPFSLFLLRAAPVDSMCYIFRT